MSKKELLKKIIKIEGIIARATLNDKWSIELREILDITRKINGVEGHNLAKIRLEEGNK